jgi:hypothetical protein
MAQSLEEIEDWVGLRLPEPYRTFLAGHEDDLQVGPLVVLYGRAYIVELNEASQSKTYCPQCITIGNDSGGREILLALNNGKLGLVDAGSMNPADASPLADDFGTWLGPTGDAPPGPLRRLPTASARGGAEGSAASSQAAGSEHSGQ